MFGLKFFLLVRSVNMLYLGNTLRERVEGVLPAKESLNYLYLTRGRKKVLWSKAFCRDLNDLVCDIQLCH